jgi:hypothetical protein
MISSSSIRIISRKSRGITLKKALRGSYQGVKIRVNILRSFVEG